MESFCKRNLCIVFIFDTRFSRLKKAFWIILPPQTTELYIV